VTDLTVNPKGWLHGTTVHRFVVDNPSAKRRTVEISLPGYRYGREGISDISGKVTVEGFSKAMIALPQPSLALSGRGFTVAEDGYESSQFNLQANEYEKWNSDELPTLLLSRTLSGEQLTANFSGIVETAATKSGRHYPGGSRSLTPLRLTLDPEAWPSDWLDYTPFDACLIAAEDYTRMPDRVCSALRAYASAGGTVVLVGTTNMPPEWVEGRSASPSLERPDAAVFSSRFGFGRILLVRDSTIESWGKEIQTVLMESFEKSNSSWSTYPVWNGHRAMSSAGIANCMKDIPVGGDLHVPVNVFFFLLLAFAVVAGPLAVMLAAKYNRRMYLLWAVPLFGVVFSGVIFVSIIMMEGVTPTLRRQAITLLDQTTRHAVTLGAVGVYAPTTLKDGLFFDNGSEVSPIAYTQIKGARIVCGQRQQYLGGWVPPRMAGFFRIRRSESRAERIVVEEKDDGSVEVVNALGAPLEWLRLWDSTGKLHSIEKLAPGEKRVLSRKDDEAPRAMKLKIDGETSVGAYEWLQATAYSTEAPGWKFTEVAVASSTACAAVPRTYIAKLAGCPFIGNPLEDVKAKGSAEAIVAGRF